MQPLGFDKKPFVRAGAVGFPEEEVLDSEILHDGAKIKKIAQLIVVHHKDNGVKYKLNIDEISIKNGVRGEVRHVALSEEATEKLFKYLLAREQFGELASSINYTLVEGSGPLDRNAIKQLNELMRRAINHKQGAQIVSSDVISNFGAVVRQVEYKKAVEELCGMLLLKNSEKDYEQWFLRNPWVFGTEYLRTEQTKKIGWRSEGDIVLTSADGYQDIIELKLPQEIVLNKDDSHDNWYPTIALSKAISQGMKYIQETEDSRLTIQEKDKLPFLKPRAKIVIGRSNEWTTEMHGAIRKLNSGLNNIQIMSYDHLIAIANRMIEYYSEEKG